MQTINPLWTAYNNLHNEGGEGYNPHPKHVGSTGEPEWSKLSDKLYRLQRIQNGTSDADPRWAELEAEIKVVEAAHQFARIVQWLECSART